MCVPPGTSAISPDTAELRVETRFPQALPTQPFHPSELKCEYMRYVTCVSLVRVKASHDSSRRVAGVLLPPPPLPSTPPPPPAPPPPPPPPPAQSHDNECDF